MAALGAGAAAATPRLHLVTPAPLSVRGLGFVRYESVRVRLLLAGTVMVRRVRASRRGRFVARFAGAAPDRCSGYAVVATGASGSVARLRMPVRPGCPPALAASDEFSPAAGS